MQEIIIKPRTESDELKTFRCLNYRYELTEKEKRYYENLEKGFEGELKFDKRISKLTNNFLVLNDLIFEHNNREFQIDSFLISQHIGYMFEVKYFEGDYYTKDEHFYSKFGKERSSPLLQLRNSESLLRQLLQQLLGINYTFEGYLAFVNPEFFLYNAPMNQPIIFPNQLNRFMNKLDNTPSKLIDKHHSLAEKLIAASKPKSSYSRIPKFTYEQLKKGMNCGKCHSFRVRIMERTLICNDCGCMEKLNNAVLRNVDEYRLLLPDRKITTNAIYDWCDIVESRKTIRNILLKRFQTVGNTSSAQFVDI